MGLYTGNLGNYYAGLETFGSYQFVSLTDIINNFRIAYVGEDKIISKISRADIKFHAMRGIQELSYDTFKSCKNLELEIPPSLLLPLPHDYVNYVKISWVDSSGRCHTIRECKACPKDPASYAQEPQDESVVSLGGGDIDVTDASLNIINPTQDESTTWGNLQNGSTPPDENEDASIENLIGARYGLDPQQANTNGCFWINCNKSHKKYNGIIYFDSFLAGKNVTIQYISDGLASDDEMIVHKFAEEAMYKHIAHSILNTRANTDRNIVATFKKERFAAVRNAKLRLSNIKLEEITQVLRGKSKWIKH